MHNNSPYDRHGYEWGRYKNNYPRGKANHWAMRDGVEEYYSEDTYLALPCDCTGDHDERCEGYFSRAKPTSAKKPPRGRRNTIIPKPTCNHQWKLIETKHINERRPWAVYRSSSTDFYLWQYPEDPIIIVQTYEQCTICRKTQNHTQSRRELTHVEHVNFDERKRMETKRRERIFRREAALSEEGGNASPKKKLRRGEKSSRKRK